MVACLANPTLHRLAVSAAALVLSLAMPFALGEARAEVKLRLTHSAPVSHPNHIAAEKMVQRIKERTKGEVVITIFPNNALGSSFETTDQVRRGIIDLDDRRLGQSRPVPRGKSDRAGSRTVPVRRSRPRAHHARHVGV